MKRTTPLLMMLFFGLMAAWTSVQSYRITQREITNQLTEALLLTQADMPSDWLSTDTIRQFRGHIRQAELREKAGLAFYTGEADDRLAGLQSRELRLSSSVRARGYLSYSALEVWWMSDQRLATVMGLLMLLSLGLSLQRGPRWNRGIQEQGMVACVPHPCPFPQRSRDLRGEGQELRLTPMQEQLVGLLMSAPEGRMSKQDICQALWPGKPDASETLYTLVRRTKQALEAEGRIRIASERGRSYRIEVG